MGRPQLAAEAGSAPTIPSLTGRIWRERPHASSDALAISQQLGVSELMGRILAGRGVSPSQAESFLKPTLRDLMPDPLHLKDMEKAAIRVADEIERGQKNKTLSTIAIFGDYDVDGATSSALLLRYFRALGLEPLVHIPDRIKEGYGPNIAAFMELKERGAKLIITVDCGTMAHDCLAKAEEAGLDVVVVDHHKSDTVLPQTHALVNPNRYDETSTHTHLAAVGVAFLLLVAVNKQLRDRSIEAPDLMQWLDLVALGTVCDVVPLTGVNRAFVMQGLKIMRARGNIGIAAAMDVARLSEAPTCYHAGFIIGPRINAGGRVGKSDLGVRLLSSTDELEVRGIAQELDIHNAERKAIETLVLQEAMQDAHAQNEQSIIVVAREGWHPGVIGIVAGRLKDHFHKPTAVIALSGGIGKASARSVSGIDLGAEVVAAVHSGLLIGGGGHAMAAGFTVAEGQVDALRQFLHGRIHARMHAQAGERLLYIDGSLALAGVTLELVKSLEQAAPFGAGNPSVRLKLSGLRIVNADIVGDGHVRVILIDGKVGAASGSLKAMAFRSADTQLGQALLGAKGRLLDVAGQAKINNWQGRESVDFFIDDAMFCA